MAEVTGDVIAEAQFDRSIPGYYRLVVCGFLFITVVGILLIPFLVGDELLVWSGIPAPGVGEADSQCPGNKDGVFFRKESTIPLNRITDLRLHDGPLMRHYGLRGLKVETAGSSGGQYGNSEGNLIGVVDAEAFRNAVLTQRQRVIEAESGRSPALTANAATAADNAASGSVLVEIRDILARIEARMPRDEE